MMKSIIKRIILIIIPSIILIIGLILSVGFINHKFQLSKEERLFVPYGELLEVNGHQIHVYTEGDGKETLVFLSGGGTSSPVLDFKSLYTLLSDKYRIVVVEKAGYGFSEITDTDRDIDTILAETREALVKLGIEGPYILAPHSMSGIEALNWVQTYPDEIKAIIGLDMAVPAAYEDYDINMPLFHLSVLAAKTGITRWIPKLSESDAIKYGTLTEEEKELYKVIFYRRTLTKNMINEINNIKANARKVANANTSSFPMLLFSSNGLETGFDEKAWKRIQRDFVSKNDRGTLVQLDSSHYVHNIDYERIAKESEEFIEDLSR